MQAEIIIFIYLFLIYLYKYVMGSQCGYWRGIVMPGVDDIHLNCIQIHLDTVWI